MAIQTRTTVPGTMGRAAALLYASVSAGVVAFQIALAAGMPWGAYAMGGAFPGAVSAQSADAAQERIAAAGHALLGE